MYAHKFTQIPEKPQVTTCDLLYIHPSGNDRVYIQTWSCFAVRTSGVLTIMQNIYQIYHGLWCSLCALSKFLQGYLKYFCRINISLAGILGDKNCSAGSYRKHVSQENEQIELYYLRLIKWVITTNYSTANVFHITVLSLLSAFKQLQIHDSQRSRLLYLRHVGVDIVYVRSSLRASLM